VALRGAVKEALDNHFSEESDDARREGIDDHFTMTQKKDSAGQPPVSLGHALEEHLAGWIRRVERTGHWTRRSDIHARLMAEVEKIVIRAALEKTGSVQTDAADFLGLNRNTLAKKIKQYGIRLPR
jgi:two-component system nitrogen regulation response regulator GlnG